MACFTEKRDEMDWFGCSGKYSKTRVRITNVGTYKTITKGKENQYFNFQYFFYTIFLFPLKSPFEHFDDCFIIRNIKE